MEILEKHLLTSLTLSIWIYLFFIYVLEYAFPLNKFGCVKHIYFEAYWAMFCFFPNPHLQNCLIAQHYHGLIIGHFFNLLEFLICYNIWFIWCKLYRGLLFLSSSTAICDETLGFDGEVFTLRICFFQVPQFVRSY